MSKSKGLLLCLMVLGCVTASGQGQSQTITWTDTTRDAYIGGQVDRTVQVFYSETPKRMALVGQNLDRVIVLDLDANTVGTLPKATLTVATDRTSATSSATAEPEIIGMLTVVDETTHGFDFGGKWYVVMRHKGIVGDLSEEKIWEDVPIWRTLMGKYQPDAPTVTALKRVEPDTTIIITAGTWCGDSKHYVPQLLRALHEAGNPHLHVKLVGIANKFAEPVDFIKQHEIKKVPTIIVERNGKEIGRIVETPVAKTIEEDLAAIFAGKPNIRKDQ
ncbi:MAG: thioredoxin family protein [Blastocatellia bacterium]